MATNVTVDQGNSSAKLSVWSCGRMCMQTSGNPLSPHVLDEVVATYGTPDTAIVSSVAPIDEAFAEALTRSCRRVMELNDRTPVPLTIGYRTPQTLGRDRIAAMVGAVTLFPGRSLLVVDAGTAVTYDGVDSAGRFVGGNIAPGIRMRLGALHHYTARLPLVAIDGEVPSLGLDTETALRSGAVNGVVAETLHYRDVLGTRLGDDNVLVVLTGGDAMLVAGMLPDIEKKVEPNLVHIGLNSIITYNENL